MTMNEIKIYLHFLIKTKTWSWKIRMALEGKYLC